jgi:HSP20 family molecular chaperone IbpA
MTFIQRGLDPFDILVRNFFHSEHTFAPLMEAKIQHPVDIFETEHGLHFEVACTGLNKSDVELNIEGDVLRISYSKDAEAADAEAQERNYIHRGIARRSFNLGYKIAPKFSLPHADAEMKDGLLKVFLPFAEEAKPKVLKIK